MNSIFILAAAVAPAAIDASPPIAATPEAEQKGLIAYPPSFFADAAPTTAFDMIQRLPGFSFEQGQDVRGLAGSGGNVLIDGQPLVSKNDRLDEALRRIPAGAVSRIELIRGGAPGVDMYGRTVIANVVRKAASGFRGAVSPAVQSVYDGRVNTSVRAEGQWRWDGRMVETSLLLARGPDDWMGDGPRVRYGPNHETQIVSFVDTDGEGIRMWATAAFETPLAGGRLRLNAGQFWEPFNGEWTDTLRVPAGREYQYQTIDRERSELGGRYTRKLAERLELEASGLQQWVYRYTTDRLDGANLSRQFTQERTSTESVGRAILRYRPSETLTVETGGEMALNTLDSRATFVQNASRLPLPNANIHVEEERAEVFLIATWRPTPRWTVEGGVRQEGSTITSEGDANLEKSLSFTKPRLVATWAPDAGSQLRVRIEREVGQLNFNDFVGSSSVVNTGAITVGNPEITPQQAWTTEIAYERRFWKGGAAVLTLRHQALSDVVDRVPILGVAGIVADAPGNIGEGIKDLALFNLTVPLERLGIRGAQFKGQLALWKSEVTDPVTGAKREISGWWPVDWEAHYTQDLPRLNSAWGVDVRSPVRERWFRLTEIETGKWDAFVNLFIEYRARPDVSVRLEVQNVLERGWQQTREVYAGPRGSGPLAYTNVRDLRFGRMILLRVRKTIGS